MDELESLPGYPCIGVRNQVAILLAIPRLQQREVGAFFRNRVDSEETITQSGGGAENVRDQEENNTSGNDTADEEVVFIEFGQLWGSIVADYTALSLSYPTDMLPALSGIASVIGSSYRPGRYFAGIWERDMHYQLAWSPNLDDDEAECFRPLQERYMAPSFSWASRIGPVSFPWECHIVSVCKIVEAGTNLNGVDTYGKVTGGCIRLEGKLIRCRVEQYDPRYWQCGISVWNGQEWEKRQSSVEFDTEEDRMELLDEQAYCFELFRARPWNENEKSEPDTVYALLLQEAMGVGSMTFTRVALAQTEGEDFDGVPDSLITVV